MAVERAERVRPGPRLGNRQWDPGLLPFEDEPVRRAEDALHWVAIYQEYRTLLATQAVYSAEEAERRRAVVERVDRRLFHWRRRYWQLSGVQELLDGAELRGASGSLVLSTREQELLAFLIAHAGSYWTARVLMLRAWGDSRLPDEQVRNYVGRLRLKLHAVGAACRIHSRRRRGYALLADPEPPALVSAVSSAVSLARLRSR